MYSNKVEYEKNCPNKNTIKNNKKKINASFNNNYEIIDNHGFEPNNLAGSPPNQFLENLKKRIQSYT